MKRSLLFLLGLSLCVLLNAADQTIVIRNVKIYTMVGNPIENGSIVIQRGVISEVGNVQTPSGAKEIDASGKSVFPGFIDSNCRVGLEEVNQVTATVDSSEATDPVTPQLSIVDAFYPDSKTIGVTRSNGVTAGIVSPDDENVITGMSALMEFSEHRIDSIVLKNPAAVHATLGEAPKSTYGARNKMPSTRMGTAAVLREAFQKAREYDVKWKEYDKKKQNPSKSDEKSSKEPQIPERNLKSEALLQVLEGKIPFVVAAHRVDDILTAIRIAEEFGIQQNLVINHGTDAYKIAGILAQKKIPVIVGPVTTQPDRMETLGARYENAALLQKAGVLIAFQSNDSHMARNLPYEAGLAVANGLPYDEALKALTINSAKIFHIDQVGSIEKGKRANLIIADGDPLEPKTVIEKIFIGGVEMPQQNYQKELWEDFQKRQQKN